MAAQTITKIVKVFAVVGYVDTLGYLYCTHCKHGDMARSIITNRVINPSGIEYGECDVCHKCIQQSIETVTGTITIEAIPCKIF
jgi:hypothetical protein